MTHVSCRRCGARLQFQLAGASEIYIKGPHFRTKLQQDIAEPRPPPRPRETPTGSRICRLLICLLIIQIHVRSQVLLSPFI